jgi:hypothetical protein
MSITMAARGTGGRRRQRAAVALAAFTVLGLGLVGCGGDSEAASDSTGGSGSSSSEDREAELVAYAECMRENGVPEFPDPEGGRLQMHAGPGTGVDPNSPEFQAAEQECEDLKPEGLGQTGGNPEQEEAMLAFSECMRENGVPGFPDPEGGRLMLTPEMGVDPESPEFQEAEEICRDENPGAPGGQ